MQFKMQNDLVQIMQIRGITLQQIADELDVSTSMVKRYLKGLCKINRERAAILMEFFGADAIYDAIDWEATQCKQPL